MPFRLCIVVGLVLKRWIKICLLLRKCFLFGYELRCILRKCFLFGYELRLYFA